MAVGPDRFGVGRAAGSDTARDLSAARRVARGLVPPPERVRSPAVTAGATVPSGFACRVASSGCQVWLRILRTGIGLRFRVSVPFGFAVTVSVGVVAASTVTGWPVVLAWASACSVVNGAESAASVCCGVSGAWVGTAAVAGPANVKELAHGTKATFGKDGSASINGVDATDGVRDAWWLAHKVDELADVYKFEKNPITDLALIANACKEGQSRRLSVCTTSYENALVDTQQVYLELFSDFGITSGGVLGAAAGAVFKGTGRPPHVAWAYIYDENMQLISSTELVSGSMTAEQAALGFPLNVLSSHTEAKALKLDIRPGYSVVIEGQYNPCPPCKGKMNKASVEIEAKIKYTWDGKQWDATFGRGWPLPPGRK